MTIKSPVGEPSLAHNFGHSAALQALLAQQPGRGLKNLLPVSGRLLFGDSHPSMFPARGTGPNSLTLMMVVIIVQRLMTVVIFVGGADAID